jgi:subtilase family serine protease
MTIAGTVSDVRVPALHPGDYFVASATATLPAPGIQAATFTADFTGQTDELDKANNTKSVSVQVYLPQQVRPDLAVGVTAVAVATPGPRYNVGVTNVGLLPSPNTTLRITRHSLTDSRIPDSVIVTPVRSLQPRGTLLVPGTPLSRGTFRVTAVIDPDAAITETSETNNSATATITTAF